MTYQIQTNSAMHEKGFDEWILITDMQWVFQATESYIQFVNEQGVITGKTERNNKIKMK